MYCTILVYDFIMIKSFAYLSDYYNACLHVCVCVIHMRETLIN